MSNTESVKVKRERRTRMVPSIVLDRPGFKPARMLFFFLLGSIIGAGLGVAFWWMLRAGGANDGALPGSGLGFLPPYLLPFLIAGLVVGISWGFLEGRTVTPRRDTVEVEVLSGRLRRRSTSTAIEHRN